MAHKNNPLRKILSGLPRARPPLVGIEVQDSTWAEWDSVVNGTESTPAAGTNPDAAVGGDRPRRRAGLDDKAGSR